MEEQFKLPPDVFADHSTQESKLVTIRTNSLDEAIRFIEMAHEKPYVGGIVLMIDSPGGFSGKEQPDWHEPTIYISYNPVMGELEIMDCQPSPIPDPGLLFPQIRRRQFAAITAQDLMAAQTKLKVSVESARLKINELFKQLDKEQKRIKHHQPQGKKARNRVISNPKYC